MLEEIKIAKEDLENANLVLTAQAAELTRANEQLEQRYAGPTIWASGPMKL